VITVPVTTSGKKRSNRVKIGASKKAARSATSRRGTPREPG
jgi:hypothetical protein